mgnify:CR=1 FL=1
MSKIGKKPIEIPKDVEVQIKPADGGTILAFKGKEGSMTLPLLPFISVDLKDGKLQFTAGKDHKQARSNWGTMASLARNAVEGVSKGFSKMLDIEGIGFRATIEGATLVLNVGFTHPVKFQPPAGVKVSVEKNAIKISGIDKNLVGEIASQIRRIKPPEPYQGKGIRYRGEVVRRKAGKKVAGTGAGAAAK